MDLHRLSLCGCACVCCLCLALFDILLISYSCLCAYVSACDWFQHKNPYRKDTAASYSSFFFFLRNYVTFFKKPHQGRATPDTPPLPPPLPFYAPEIAVPPLSFSDNGCNTNAPGTFTILHKKNDDTPPNTCQSP